MALPAAMIMLFIMTTLAIVVVTNARTADSNSRRDRATKRAVAAVDAGFDTAIYRLNQIKPANNQCVVVNGSGQLGTAGASADGWCPAQTEDLGDTETLTYRTTPATAVTTNGQNLLTRKIMSVGTSSMGSSLVTRRALTNVASNTANPLVGNYAMVSTDPTWPLVLQNNTRIEGDIGSNSSIYLQNSAQLCGDALYGKDWAIQSPNANQGGLLQCLGASYGSSHTKLTEPLILAPIDQRDAPTNNNNSSIPNTISGWDAAKRRLVLGTGDNLTLVAGGVYSFCYFQMGGSSKLNISGSLLGGTPTRIYIDAPENCTSLSSGERGDVSIGNSANINNTTLDPSTFIMFVVGSPRIMTYVTYDNSSSTAVPMVIYAPSSTLSIQNNTVIKGAVAAYRISVKNYAKILWDPLVGALSQTQTIPVYRRTKWKECVVKQPTSVPDSGC
jgi:hypothetical protein